MTTALLHIRCANPAAPVIEPGGGIEHRISSWLVSEPRRWELKIQTCAQTEAHAIRCDKLGQCCRNISDLMQPSCADTFSNIQGELNIGDNSG